MRALGVHDFGGGFMLGVRQAGFEIVGKKSREVGFGVLNCLANRTLVGDNWESETGTPSMWVPQEAELIFSNPPCSGFSTLSPKHFRGESSTINDCMWELVRYAGKVGPEIVIFESVQQAFTQGRTLMRALRAELEAISGYKYTLYHVLHNNAALGGASIRRRYFWLASRIPFGVEWNATRWDFRKHELIRYDLERVPSFNEVLCDLVPLNITMERQPYRGLYEDFHEAWNGHEWVRTNKWVDTRSGSWWTRDHMHDGTGTVDGNDIARSPTYDRIKEMLGLEEWRPGERMSDVMRRYWERHGELPSSWHYMSKKPTGELDENGKKIYEPIRKDKRLIETDFAMGHNQPCRWRGDRMARVITGGAVHLIVHPTLNRTLTQREAARIQGFPDAWKIWPVRNAADLGPGWGKGVPVHAGRWIADWAYQSIQGEPGSLTGMPGKECGDRELVIDVTAKYKPFTKMIGDPG